MEIKNAQTAAEFVAAWSNQSKTLQITHLTIAIEGQEARRGYAELYGHKEMFLDTCEAIGVLRLARHNLRTK